MSKTFTWLSLQFVAVVLGAVCTVCNASPPAQPGTVRPKCTLASDGPPVYTAQEINRLKLGPGVYCTEGYVVIIHVCPPCPAHAQCKPCSNNIVISEHNHALETYSLSDAEMLLLTEHPRRFKLGGRYQFLIRILPEHLHATPINDAEIIRYRASGTPGCT